MSRNEHSVHAMIASPTAGHTDQPLGVIQPSRSAEREELVACLDAVSAGRVVLTTHRLTPGVDVWMKFASGVWMLIEDGRHYRPFATDPELRTVHQPMTLSGDQVIAMSQELTMAGIVLTETLLDALGTGSQLITVAGRIRTELSCTKEASGLWTAGTVTVDSRALPLLVAKTLLPVTDEMVVFRGPREVVIEGRKNLSDEHGDELSVPACPPYLTAVPWSC